VTQHTTDRVKRKRDGAAGTRPLSGGKKPSATAAAAVEGRANKNAPAVMKSNRPVRRLRIDANNTTRKFRDPRFTEGSGKLDHDKFHQNYAFLDEYQEDEVNALGRALKKTKNVDKREELKAELLKRKQELTERRRSLKVKARLQAAKQEEREKVKNGKTPFFLKRSAKKQIALEERYDELKKEGKLSSFLQKKRKRNASKEHKSMPRARSWNGGGSGGGM
jgi:ribosomal RNA-processing protein 36